MFENFLFLALPGLGLMAMGVKALTPAGIQLTETRQLSRRASTMIGIVAISLGLGTVALSFFVNVFPHLLRRSSHGR